MSEVLLLSGVLFLLTIAGRGFPGAGCIRLENRWPKSKAFQCFCSLAKRS